MILFQITVKIYNLKFKLTRKLDSSQFIKVEK